MTDKLPKKKRKFTGKDPEKSIPKFILLISKYPGLPERQKSSCHLVDTQIQYWASSPPGLGGVQWPNQNSCRNTSHQTIPKMKSIYDCVTCYRNSLQILEGLHRGFPFQTTAIPFALNNSSIIIFNEISKTCKNYYFKKSKLAKPSCEQHV